MQFQLEGHPFIELNKLLKRLHFVGTGGEANIRIENGEARVNGVRETRKRKKLVAGDRVEFGGQIVEIL
ncbi:MAG: RNA-binding S4 domain-containing protein [Bacteroidota bacterium]